MDTRHMGCDEGRCSGRVVALGRLAAMLAAVATIGLATARIVPAVLVSPDGTYYRPSMPADATIPTTPSCPNDVCATADVSALYEGLTDIEYSYDMNSWVGFLAGIGSVFGASPETTLVDGNGDEYPLSGGGGSAVCIPLSDVLCRGWNGRLAERRRPVPGRADLGWAP